MRPSPSPASKYCRNVGCFICIFVFILLYACLSTRNDAYKIHGKDSSSFKGSNNNLKPAGESNTDREEERECGHNEAKLVLLKDGVGRCIDGSSPGYYIRRGFGEGAGKWMLHFEGGGWCYDLEACYLRGKTVLGSSRNYPTCLSNNSMRFYMSSRPEENPMMHSWNTVLVKYCDGSSYAGNAVQQFQGNPLYFLGQVNRDAVVRSLLSLGMASASHVVISGCSAGGLGIYLGIDQMAAIVQQQNPQTIVRGLADSGYFLEHSSDFPAAVTHYPLGKDEAVVAGRLDYGRAMRRVFRLTNMTAGAHTKCILANPGQEEVCVFAENVVGFIRTPTFALQPQYDQWQILHVIGRNYNTSAVNAFGARIVSSLLSRFLSHPPHGAFVDSCSHHCTSCSASAENVWAGRRIHSTLTSHSEDMNPAKSFGTWFEQSVSGRYPNLSQRLFYQNMSFPCDSCCLCRVYH